MSNFHLTLFFFLNKKTQNGNVALIIPRHAMEFEFFFPRRESKFVFTKNEDFYLC